MVSLAQTIRDRDMSIRRFVETSMVAVSEENDTIKSQIGNIRVNRKNHQNHSTKFMPMVVSRWMAICNPIL
jgi:hypothetical protein